MLENNETSVHGRDLGQPSLEGGNDRLGGGRASGDVPVVCIETVSPDGGLVAESGGNVTDTVVDITIRRAPVDGGDTNGINDGLLGPLQLGQDLLVRQRGHHGVRPGVDGDLVSLVVGTLQGVGPADGARTDNEQRRLGVVCLEDVVQTLRIGRWTIWSGSVQKKIERNVITWSASNEGVSFCQEPERSAV